METSVIKNRIIPGIVRRPALRERKPTEEVLKHENARRWKRTMERADEILTSILSVLVPQKLDRSYYDRARNRLYY